MGMGSLPEEGDSDNKVALLSVRLGLLITDLASPQGAGSVCRTLTVTFDP